MKIAITGTLSTGKTTLCQEAAKAFDWPLAVVSTDKAIDYCATHNMFLRDVKLYQENRISRRDWLAGLDIESQLDFEAANCFVQEMEEDAAGDNFLADNNFVMRLVYLMYFCSAKSSTDNTLFDDIYIMCKKRIRAYDWVIYLPPYLPHVDDQRRPVSPYIRTAQDYILRSILDEMRDNPKNYPPVKTIYATRPEDRLAVLTDIIRGYSLRGAAL